MTDHPYTSRDSSPSEQSPSGLWLWVISIGLGSTVIGFFVPIFFILVIGSFFALPILFVRSHRMSESLQYTIDSTRERERYALHNGDLLRGVINAADIPLLATDEFGVIAHSNQRALDVFGIGPALFGRRFDEILTQEPLHDIETLARQGEPGHARLQIPIKGEMRDFDVSADPVMLSKGAVLTFRDITELSNAMTLKTDFVANASHELRTPISAIKIATETLSGPAKDDPGMSSRLIEMITGNASRLELLANDLLDLSRLESPTQQVQIESVRIDDLVIRLFEHFENLAQRNSVELTLENPEEIQSISSDPTLLALILRNLIQNAIKFAHNDTQVQVVIEPAMIMHDRTSPVPKELEHKRGISIQVIDQGVGIPLAHQQRIFERFYQVDDSRTGGGAKTGTGLGLAIVKHAAKSLGGQIGVESISQVGTTMRIDLPSSLPD